MLNQPNIDNEEIIVESEKENQVNEAMLSSESFSSSEEDEGDEDYDPSVKRQIRDSMHKTHLHSVKMPIADQAPFDSEDESDEGQEADEEEGEEAEDSSVAFEDSEIAEDF